MKRVVFIFLAVGLFSMVANAQSDADTAWKKGLEASLLGSQVGFTNWAPGGDNNLTFNGFLNFYARYEKGNKKWENMLSLAYGQSKIGKQEFRKNEDKIDLLSAYGIKASDKWYYTANFNFKSQFTSGYNYHDDTIAKEKISNFLAPAYISLGLGMEYRPHDYISFYISPATARWIIVNDTLLASKGAFGVEKAYVDDNGIYVPGETSKFEFGAYFRFMFKKDIVKNVNLSTKLELFSNYIENPQNIDINWDTMINMTINSWLSANFGLQMVYDDDTPIVDADGKEGPRTQIKQMLGVGLTYKVSSK